MTDINVDLAISNARARPSVMPRRNSETPTSLMLGGSDGGLRPRLLPVSWVIEVKNACVHDCVTVQHGGQDLARALVPGRKSAGRELEDTAAQLELEVIQHPASGTPGRRILVRIASNLWDACVSFSHKNVYVVGAGGAALVVVHPFSEDGVTAARRSVSRTGSMFLDAAETTQAALDRAAHMLRRECGGGPTDNRPSGSTASFVPPDIAAPTDVVLHMGGAPGIRHRDKAAAATTRTQDAAPPGPLPRGSSNARAHDYLLTFLFVLGIMAVSVLSAYIIFFGNLQFTLQTGVSFARAS
jgi:hypothetical protein